VARPDLEFDLLGSLTSFGNPFAWKVVLSFYTWALLSQKVPGTKTFCGPPAPHGFVPEYAANGFQYYFCTLGAFLLLIFVYPDFCHHVYQDFGPIVQVLNITALAFCAYLFIKGKLFPESGLDPLQNFQGKSWAYIFYRGVELHPTIFGADVKQWTNSRVGMMAWAMLVLVFCKVDLDQNGFHIGPVVHALLINIYLAKFFYWETGYFNTLDITMDRAGYYLCWGCLCWVQASFTNTAYFMVAYPSQVSTWEGIAILFYGLLCTYLEYQVDHQKEEFRATDGNEHIWGQKPQYLKVEYKGTDGKVKQSKLLTSGFWGKARHMNYFFEINIALSWSLPARGYGIVPYGYFVFITILVLQRILRDEEKLKKKKTISGKKMSHKQMLME